MTTEQTPQTLEQQVASLQGQLTWLTAQVAHLYGRMQMNFVPVQAAKPSDGRTESGMGAIVSPDKTSYL
jgi:uncharacterized coiled-coil protein SlyX